jgi:DNA-directed RNA polymerase sigma subunit (sigma70/sigma32)
MSIRFENYERLIFNIIMRNRPGLHGEIRDSEEYSLACLVFTKCARKFKPQKGFQFSTFFGRSLELILRTSAKQAIEANDRFKTFRDMDLFHSRTDEQDVDAKEFAEYILSRIDPQHRDALIAVRDGLTNADVGKQTFVSTEYARQRRKNALRQARRIAMEAL